MFRHILKYGLLSLLRTKEIVFWTLIFPFALTTFMYFAFSNLYNTTEQFHAIRWQSYSKVKIKHLHKY